LQIIFSFDVSQAARTKRVISLQVEKPSSLEVRNNINFPLISFCVAFSFGFKANCTHALSGIFVAIKLLYLKIFE
jgi:hypothetical protein